MKEPKYRFLFGISGRATAGYGYVDKQTGEIVFQQPDNAETVVFGVPVGMDILKKTEYVASDGLYVDENSYVCLYDYLSGQQYYDGYQTYIQVADIIGKPYAWNYRNTPHITGTIDLEEVKQVTSINTPEISVYFLWEAHPFYSKLNKKIGREDGHMFFRETLDTDLHFVGKEADFIQRLTPEIKFMLVCQKLNYDTQRWENYHVDLFKQTECEFDNDTHTCKPVLTPLDSYTRLLAKYSDEYDLIKLKPAIKRIKTHLRPIIELYEAGSSVITRFLGGTYWEAEVNTPIDDEQVLVNDEHFRRLIVDNDTARMQVVSDDEILTIRPPEGYPYTAAYKYDAATATYQFENDYGLWEWVVETQYSLTLYLNSVQILVATPNNGQQPIRIDTGDLNNLPLDQITSGIYVDGGLDEFGRIVHYHIGGASFKRYSIYGRVIGNGNTLFGMHTFNIPADDFAISSHAYKKCAPLGDQISPYPDDLSGYFYGTLDTSLKPTIYGIKENEEEYYTNENLPVEGGIYGVKPMPIGKYEWGDISYWYNYADDYVDAEVDSRWDYVLKDCFTIGATIRALLAKIDHSITFSDSTVCSEFLFGKPDIKGGYGWKLAITPKSNVLKGDYDQPAKKAPITFESLMNMLRDLYHLYWYIDRGRRLHIEHAVWFINGGSYTAFTGDTQLDLSGDNCKDAYNKKRTAYWQDAYKFNMAEASRRIELNFAEDGTEFFNGLSIDIRDVYLQKAKTDAKSISNFTSDIDLMRVEPERYSMDGFAILTYVDRKAPPIFSTDTDEEVDAVIPVVGANRVMERDGWQRDAYINNFFASWLYCQHFLMYDISGDDMEQELQLFTMPNGNSLDEVHGLARLKKQEVQFPFEEDPDTIDLIKTTVGDGKPEDFSVDALTRTVKATLSFPVKELP